MGKPRYLEIKEWIKDQIDSSRLTTGDRVYSEKELSDRFNVSRITSKRALEELVKDDYIVRKQGKEEGRKECLLCFQINSQTKKNTCNMTEQVR